MKKILLSSAFLALSAGVAVAQVSLSGSARFGAIYMGGVSGTAATGSAAQIAAAQAAVGAAQTAADASAAVVATNTAAGTLTAADLAAADADAAALAGQQAALDAIDGTPDTDSTFSVTNRFTLNIDGNAETDGGVNFFARVRVRGGNTGISGLSASGVSAPRVGASFGGFTVAVGNILGALESTPGLYAGAVGLTGLGWGNVPTNYAPAGAFAWDSFSSSGSGSNGVEAIYSAGAFGAAFSYSDSDGGSRSAFNLSYNFGDWTAALGTQTGRNDNEDMTVATLTGNIGDFGIGLAYAALEGDTDTIRANASYTFGSGTTIVGYVADTKAAGADTAFGIGFTQSLGGATLVGGYVSDSAGRDRADLGVRFSF